MIEKTVTNESVVKDVEDLSSDKAVENTTSPSELTGFKLFLVIFGLGLTVFLMSLDGSIIATAIPSITSQFQSTADIAWYGSAYTFTMCAFQPMTGKILAKFPVKTTFIVFMVIFQIGSLLCATAVNSDMLIIGRSIAGIGVAGGMTGTWTILAMAVPLEKRPMYIGLLQSVYGFSMILGPVIGGAITQHSTWRVCFYINLPIGAVTLAFVTIFFKSAPSQTTEKAESIWSRIVGLDIIGLVLFVPSILMILLTFQWGGTQYAWKSATIIGLIIGGVLLGLVFIGWQTWKGDEAMIPPKIFTKRNVMFSCFTEFFATGAVFTCIYYLPEWFQVVKGASPSKSGVMYLPLSLADIIAAMSTGILLKFVGYPTPFIYLGTSLMAIGTGLLTTLSPSSGSQYWIPYQILQGLGAGMTLSMPYVATQTILKEHEFAIATSMLQCLQFLGSSIFLSVSQAVFSNQLSSSLTGAGLSAEMVDTIIHAGAADIRNVTDAKDLDVVVSAFNTSIVSTFYVATAVAAVACIVSLGIKWTSIRAKND